MELIPTSQPTRASYAALRACPPRGQQTRRRIRVDSTHLLELPLHLVVVAELPARCGHPLLREGELEEVALRRS